MKRMALFTMILGVVPHLASATQAPLAASHEIIRSVSRVTASGGPRLADLDLFASPTRQNASVRPHPAVTAPIYRTSGADLLNDESRGGARVGTVLGWVVGMTAGPALFAGNDLGCNKYGECYGRLGSGDAILAGALVMGAAGFLSGTVLGAVEAPDWCADIPLDALNLGFAPDGKPGVKMLAEVRF